MDFGKMKVLVSDRTSVYLNVGVHGYGGSR